MNPRELDLAVMAAKQLPRPAGATMVKKPEGRTKKPLKYIFHRYGGRYRASVRLDYKLILLGTFDTEAEALQAQKDFCTDQGTTYDEVFHPHQNRLNTSQ